uniref:Retinol dehydrogenase 11 n=1 Tax=Cuerna arida TaxID=1464854 RepID=A0A1B6FQY9_9HEMI
MEVLDIILQYPMISGAIFICTTTWLYFYFICGVCKSKARMDGKTVIITGCNTGIGKAVAFDLARRGARVIMACRNMEKANLVRDRIIESTKNTSVVVRLLDVSLLSSVRKFAEEINRTERRLDVLIYNAGMTIDGRNVTKEGLQLVWATNHYGSFLLTHLLIDLLKKTGNSRVIVVSSSLHKLGWVDPKNPNPVEETSGWNLYVTTKFANVIFANELARRLEGTGVTVNSLHPGLIYTNIFNPCSSWFHILLTVFKPYTKNEEQGAQTTIYLAVSEDVQGVSGKYFSDCKEDSPARETLDVGLAKKFWEASIEVVQLKSSDPHI